MVKNTTEAPWSSLFIDDGIIIIIILFLGFFRIYVRVILARGKRKQR